MAAEGNNLLQTKEKFASTEEIAGDSLWTMEETVLLNVMEKSSRNVAKDETTGAKSIKRPIETSIGSDTGDKTSKKVCWTAKTKAISKSNFLQTAEPAKSSSYDQTAPSASTKSTEGSTFVGPARTLLPSFQSLCLSTMDFHWSSWRSYDSPKSYIVPPIFSFMNPETSDTDFELEQEKTVERGINAIVKHRVSDQAEFIVHRVLTQLIHEAIQAPFIAIQGLNIERVQHILPQLFPDMRWKRLKETLRTSLEQQLSRLCPEMHDTKRALLLERFLDGLPKCIGGGMTKLRKYLRVSRKQKPYH